MNIFKLIKYARMVSKVKKIIKKENATVEEIESCIDGLREYAVELEEGKSKVSDDIKKIKKLTTELYNKIKKEVK